MDDSTLLKQFDGATEVPTEISGDSQIETFEEFECGGLKISDIVPFFIHNYFANYGHFSYFQGMDKRVIAKMKEFFSNPKMRLTTLSIGLKDMTLVDQNAANSVTWVLVRPWHDGRVRFVMFGEKVLDYQSRFLIRYKKTEFSKLVDLINEVSVITGVDSPNKVCQLAGFFLIRESGKRVTERMNLVTLDLPEPEKFFIDFMEIQKGVF